MLDVIGNGKVIASSGRVMSWKWSLGSNVGRPYSEGFLRGRKQDAVNQF